MSPTHQQRQCLGVERVYADYLSSGDWRIQRCRACSECVFYPRQLCPHCGGDAFDWIEPCGLGTLYSVSVIHAGSKAGGSYNVALIDLDEGVRMMSRIEGVENQHLKIGLRVRARVVRDASSDSNLVVFEKAGS